MNYPEVLVHRDTGPVITRGVEDVFCKISMCACENMKLETEKRNDKLEVIRNFMSKYFLQLGAVLIIPFGIFIPQPAVYLGEKLPIVKICIIAIFFVFGTKFRLAEVKSAMRCYKEIAVGLIGILLVTPLIGTNLLKLPQFGKVIGSDSEQNISGKDSDSAQLPVFGPEEFRIGLQIFCLSPCASAFPTIVVTAANGNRAVTLLIAILCTIISVFTVPVMIPWLIPAAEKVNFSFLIMLLRIILFILLPLLVGRILRFVPIVKTTVVKLNKSLKFVTSTALLLIFWVKISQTSAKGNLERFSPLSILAVTALGTAIITSYLVVTYGLLLLLPFSKKSTLAIAILSSARNSSVAITIIDNLPDSIGDKDLMFFPVVFVYLAMIVILNTFGSFMAIKDDKSDAELASGIALPEEGDEVAEDCTNNASEDSLEFDGVVVCIESTISEYSRVPAGTVYIEVREDNKSELELRHWNEITVANTNEKQLWCTTDGPVSDEKPVCIQTVHYCYEELDVTNLLRMFS